MSLLKLIIFTLAFIGLGTAIYSFQQVGTWLNNTDYDEYVFYTVLGIVSIILHIVAFAKFGWRAIYSPILPVYFVLGVFGGIFWVTGILVYRVSTFVGIVSLIVLSIGFSVLVEYLSERLAGKTSGKEKP